jgi:tetratricopeptide (TPR) repeat protein
MPAVFISYRRDDSGPHTGRLFDHLCEHYGQDCVFRDLHGLVPGDDFADRLKAKLVECDALLAVIGPRWHSIADKKTGRRRLDDPDDFVVLEIATAIEARKFVVPVLVEGAKMPRADQLPASIRGLAARQAAELTDSHFAIDVQRLVEAIDKGDPDPTLWERVRRALRTERMRVRLRWALAGVGAAAGVLALVLTVGAPAPAELGALSAAQVQSMLHQRRAELDGALATLAPGASDERARLEAARRALDERLADLPATTAQFNASLRRVDAQLAGDDGRAGRDAREALRRQDTAPARLRLAAVADGTDPAQAAPAAFELGELAYAELDFTEAARRLKQAARLAPDNAAFHNAAGRIAHELGDFDAARRHLDAALALRRQAQPPDLAALTESLVNLALLDKQQRRHAEAEALLLEALERQGSGAADADRIGLVKNNLAQLYRAAAPDTPAMREKIERLLDDALAAARQAHGADSLAAATALNNLAAFHVAVGQAGTAQPLYESALKLREARLPAGHPDIAASLNNLAALHAGDGRPAEAEALYRRALAIQAAAFGPEHPAVATTQNNLGQALHRLRRVGDAEAAYRRALATLGTASALDPLALAFTRNNLGLLLLDTQRAADAEPLLRDAATTLLALLPVQNEHVKTVVGNYVECLQRLNRAGEAQVWRARLDAAPTASS